MKRFPPCKPLPPLLLPSPFGARLLASPAGRPAGRPACLRRTRACVAGRCRSVGSGLEERDVNQSCGDAMHVSGHSSLSPPFLYPPINLAVGVGAAQASMEGWNDEQAATLRQCVWGETEWRLQPEFLQTPIGSCSMHAAVGKTTSTPDFRATAQQVFVSQPSGITIAVCCTYEQQKHHVNLPARGRIEEQTTHTGIFWYLDTYTKGAKTGDLNRESRGSTEVDDEDG
ncbi:hypothetical protein GUJ93_ZPchr0012g19959 [Zizania palustris]|uniref:Uncharacterized protein n=1 Tax=Zizania palustris TaxID=103762 RepID=A0A8J6BWU7_ZIZPA|nr:hypothetical protein GUJ93_ZPchr0012g19959 [Zizania palustris]